MCSLTVNWPLAIFTPRQTAWCAGGVDSAREVQLAVLIRIGGGGLVVDVSGLKVLPLTFMGVRLTRIRWGHATRVMTACRRALHRGRYRNMRKERPRILWIATALPT